MSADVKTQNYEKFLRINFSEKNISLLDKPPQKVKKIEVKFFCKHGILTWLSIQKENLYPHADQGPLQHMR